MVFSRGVGGVKGVFEGVKGSEFHMDICYYAALSNVISLIRNRLNLILV